MPYIDKKYQVINGSTLKIIAIVIMFIDHIGAGILSFLPGYGFVENAELEKWNMIYTGFRMVGRTAFPLFCFLLVEGFFHTRNVKNYALRLLAFAFISEIPFDLVFFDKVVHWQNQNVFFTLFLGLATIYSLDWLKSFIRAEHVDLKSRKNQVLAIIGMIGTIIIGCGLSILMKTDYSFHGVGLIVIFYILRNNRVAAVLAGYVSFFFSTETYSLPGFLLILLYNGKRGLTKTKINYQYLFYAFYPVHMLLLFGIRCFIKIFAP